MATGFAEDLALGKHFEQLYLKITRVKGIRRTYNSSPEGKYYPYDLAITTNGERTKYEVKADKITNSSGNIAIEYACGGQASGILKTESDFYIYFVIVPVTKSGDNFTPEDYDYIRYYRIPTEVIKDELRKKTYHTIKCGGDKKRAELCLFKESLFVDYLIVNPIEPIEYNEEEETTTTCLLDSI